jgi:hypothetical protein
MDGVGEMPRVRIGIGDGNLPRRAIATVVNSG